MTVIEVTSEDQFDQIISSNKVVLVDFYATWCGPCKMISPKIDKLAEELKQITVCKVDVDELENLAGKNNIENLPSFGIFVDGERKNIVVGANVEKVQSALNPYL